MRNMLAIPLVLTLVGCSGTIIEMDGTICNQPVKLRLADRKDRSAFDLTVTCGQDGGVNITTAESSSSQVITAQARALTDLAAVLAQEAAEGVLP